MAVFVCSADESADQNPKGNFFYAGCAASLEDWSTFETAWNERVLRRRPAIPYLHITDIRKTHWQKTYGLSSLHASDKLDEAARVIRSMGSMVPFCVSVTEPEFDATVRQRFRLHPKQTVEFVPDYLCFMAFTVVVLDQLASTRTDVDRVDFVVERNGRITRHIQAFHNQAYQGFVDIGRNDLASLIGTYTVVAKECVQTQVADMLAWHARNFERGTLDGQGARRLWRMLDGKPDRYYLKVSSDLLRQLAERYSATDSSPQKKE